MSRITYLTPGDVKRLPTIGLGGTWSFPRVKKVTPAVALVLVEETANLTLGQDGLKSIDNLSLRRLVSRPGNLWLNVLASLTDEQVEILARNNEGYLSLNGVKNLSDASAKVLARHNGRVHLRGLEKISDEGRYALRLADATLPHSLQYTTHREAGSDARRVVDP